MRFHHWPFPQQPLPVSKPRLPYCSADVDSICNCWCWAHCLAHWWQRPSGLCYGRWCVVVFIFMVFFETLFFLNIFLSVVFGCMWVYWRGMMHDIEVSMSAVVARSMPPVLNCVLKPCSGLEISGNSTWNFRDLVVRGFYQGTLVSSPSPLVNGFSYKINWKYL